MKIYSTDKLPSQQVIDALHVVLSQNSYDYSNEVELEFKDPLRDATTYHKVFISKYLTKQQFERLNNVTDNN